MSEDLTVPSTDALAAFRAPCAEPPKPPTRIAALRGKLVVERDAGPAVIGSIIVPEVARDKRGARTRAVLGTVRGAGLLEGECPLKASDYGPCDCDVFRVGQRILFEESSEHGVSEYLPSLGPNLVIVRQDKVLAVLEDS